jgi:hypothetical protein
LQETFVKEIGRNNIAVTVSIEDKKLLDDETWTILSQRGRVSRVVRSRDKKPLHRLIMGEPDGIVDHVNRNPLDNRRCNLRIATVQENSANCRKRKEGTKHVYWNKKSGKWSVQIPYKMRTLYFGMFDDIAEATALAIQKGKELNGEYWNPG